MAAYSHNYNNPDALPAFAEPERRGAKASTSQPPPAHGNPRSPPAHQQTFRPQPHPQYHQDQQQPHYQRPPPPQQHQPHHQPHQQHQQHRQQSYPQSAPHDPYARWQPEPQAYPPAAGPPRDAYGGGSGRGYPGLPSGPPLPRSPAPPSVRSPTAPAAPSSSAVLFPGDQPLSREQTRGIFNGIDVDRNGYVTEQQLADSLVNGDSTRFNAHTVAMMIRMFAKDENKYLDFDAFFRLWSFLLEWRVLFNQFDEDHSGTINLDEFRRAIVSFQFRLSDAITAKLFRRNNKHATEITFDVFMQTCIILKQMTDSFKEFDHDRDGFITIGFEDFIRVVLDQI